MMDLQMFLEFLEPIAHLWNEQAVTEIRINPNGTVFVERDGRIRQERVTITDNQLAFAAGSLSGHTDRPFDEGNPRLDCRLPDGSRVALTHPPITRKIAVLIRRFPIAYTMTQLIDKGTVSREHAELLLGVLRRRRNLVISGATRSGKTTFLRALLNELPKAERLVLIEDPAELNLADAAHRDIYEIECRDRSKNVEPFTPREGVRSALRYSPDRIIVGEIRGPEASDFIDALNTGHGGSATSIHGDTGDRSLRRLATLVQRGDPQQPYSVVVPLVADSVHYVAHLDRSREGCRQLTEIVEVTGTSDDRLRFVVNPVFERIAHA